MLSSNFSWRAGTLLVYSDPEVEKFRRIKA